MRKPKVPDYVPQQSIRWLMGRVHVSTPDAEVEADMRSRFRVAVLTKVFTEEQVDACVAYAIACHRENQGLYNRVVSGRF